jgi:hypothetical protein
MKTSYFTFGQGHRHEIGGVVYDKDCVLKITAEDPRAVMFEMFGPKWSMEYDEPQSIHVFPRGTFEINR